jgi:tetratricopeptide (TPR) repeat protein
MIEVEFDLRRAAATGSVDALLVDGCDVRRLLLALDGGRFDARIFTLARSHADATVAGFLAVLASPLERAPAGAVALRRLGSRLYIPHDAQLWPSATEAEIDAALDARVHLTLPGGRRYAFEPALALAPEQLLDLGPRSDVAWNRARAGTRLAPRIVAVELAAPVDLTRFFDEPAQEIGSNRLEELGKASGEPEPTRALGSQATRWIARGVVFLADKAPSGAPAPTWIDRMAKWAGGILAAELSERRVREVQRLMKLLDSDPARGLKFALPVGGVAGRGLSAPSSVLGARSTDFDLRELSSNAPADFWSLPHEVREELLKRYRNLAQTEKTLGRHRRAAFIHAHLLGDLRSAAKVLAEGRHFREAAALLLERLNDAPAAAECLERGGFAEEALAIWTARSGWLNAAALLERLGRGDEAREFWRRAASELDKHGDRLGAAALLDSKLGDLEGALALLAADWPTGQGAELRRLRWMELLVRERREREAASWIEEQSAAAPDARTAKSLAQLLVGVVKGAHTGPVRDIAAFELRSVIGRALSAHPDAARSLPTLLTRAGLDDPILRRDVARFGRGRARAPNKPGASEPAGFAAAFEVGALAPERCAFASTTQFLFVVRPTSERERPRLECWSWRTGALVASWEWRAAPALDAKPWIHVIEQARSLRVLVGPLASSAIWEQLGAQRAEGFRIVAGAPAGFVSRVLGVAGVQRGDFVVLTATDEAETRLLGYDANLGLRGAVHLEHDELVSTGQPIALAMHESSVLIGLGPRGSRNDSRFAKPFFLGDDVQTARVLDQGELSFMLVTTREKVEVLSVDSRSEGRGTYSEELAAPCAALLPSGALVAADRSTLAIAVRRGDTYQRLARAPAPLPDVLAVLPAAQIDSFALVASDGRVRVLRAASFGA